MEWRSICEAANYLIYRLAGLPAFLFAVHFILQRLVSLAKENKKEKEKQDIMCLILFSLSALLKISFLLHSMSRVSLERPVTGARVKICTPSFVQDTSD